MDRSFNYDINSLTIDVWEANRKKIWDTKPVFERAEQLWIRAAIWVDRNIFIFIESIQISKSKDGQ